MLIESLHIGKMDGGSNVELVASLVDEELVPDLGFKIGHVFV
jgi:hypothetical protein